MSAQAWSAASAPARRLGDQPGAATARGAVRARRAEPSPASPYRRERRPLGDPSPLACTLAKAALEAVHGADTLGTLTRWADPQVRTSLAKQHSLARRAGLEGDGTAQVLRARVCRVAMGAAEVSVVATWGERTHAIALRLEDRHGRWVATVIDVG